MRIERALEASDVLTAAGLRPSVDLAFALECAARLVRRALLARRAAIFLASARTRAPAGAVSVMDNVTWGYFFAPVWEALSAAPSVAAFDLDGVLVAPVIRGARLVGAVVASRGDLWTAADRDALRTTADVVETLLGQAAWTAAAEPQQARPPRHSIAKRAATWAHALNTVTATLNLIADSLTAREDAPEWLAEPAHDLAQLAAQHHAIVEQVRELASSRGPSVLDARELVVELAPLIAALPRRIQLSIGDRALWIYGDRRELARLVAARLLAACEMCPRDADIVVRFTQPPEQRGAIVTITVGASPALELALESDS